MGQKGTEQSAAGHTVVNMGDEIARRHEEDMQTEVLQNADTGALIQQRHLGTNRKGRDLVSWLNWKS
jgi:hypothetical protein